MHPACSFISFILAPEGYDGHQRGVFMHPAHKTCECVLNDILSKSLIDSFRAQASKQGPVPVFQLKIQWFCAIIDTAGSIEDLHYFADHFHFQETYRVCCPEALSQVRTRKKMFPEEGSFS